MSFCFCSCSSCLCWQARVILSAVSSAARMSCLTCCIFTASVFPVAAVAAWDLTFCIRTRMTCPTAKCRVNFELHTHSHTNTTGWTLARLLFVVYCASRHAALPVAHKRALVQLITCRLGVQDDTIASPYRCTLIKSRPVQSARRLLAKIQRVTTRDHNV